MGAVRTTAMIATVVAMLSVTTPGALALAHEGEAHAPTQPVAPATIPQVNEPVVGGGGGTPAPGAQPARPSGLPPVVGGTGAAGVGNGAGAGAGAGTTGATGATGATGTTGATGATGAGTAGATGAVGTSGTSGTSGTTTTIMPKADLTTISEPVTTTPKTASGGGTGDDQVDVADAGANVVPNDAAAAAGGGDLPFTGIEETILLIAVAGMFVPIGVLLYCGARRGDRRRVERGLSMPRFQWAPPTPRG